MIFWILWSIDALVAAVFVFFFVVGIGDGSVSSFNIVLWLGILAALAGVLGGGWALKHFGQKWGAIALLALLAVPAILAALFFAVLIISNPRMN